MASPRKNPAVVLAAFGTTDPEALKEIGYIRAKAAEVCPGAGLHLAFTSRVIRGRWRGLAGEAAFRARYPEISGEFFEIRSPLSVLAAIQEEAPRPILVQPLHLAGGEEFSDLQNLVAALAAVKTGRPDQRPFPWLALGPPALGDGGEEALTRAARALRPLTAKARLADAALVLVGHGNRRLDLPLVYGALEKHLRREYPPTYVGLLEGGPGPEDILAALPQTSPGRRRALMAPLLTVAGAHAKNDLAGGGPGSWVSRFRAAGLEVEAHTAGLGALDGWAGLYAENIRRGLAGLEMDET